MSVAKDGKERKRSGGENPRSKSTIKIHAELQVKHATKINQVGMSRMSRDNRPRDTSEAHRPPNSLMSAVPNRGRSKCGRSQKHTNARKKSPKRAETQVRKKSAKGRKRVQKSASA